MMSFEHDIECPVKETAMPDPDPGAGAPSINPPELMAAAAKAFQCKHLSYRQKLIIEKSSLHGKTYDEGGNGICYGLAVTWLEEVKRNNLKQTPRFLAAISVPDGVAFTRAHAIFGMQQESPTWQKMTGLTPAAVKKDDSRWTGDDPSPGKTDMTANRPYEDKSAGEGKGGPKRQEYYLSQEDMKKFTTWLAAAWGTRYFLVHVKGHAMAACGSRRGELAFFDPNGGVVISNAGDNLAKCIRQYLKQMEQNRLYCGLNPSRIHDIQMIVDKLK